MNYIFFVHIFVAQHQPRNTTPLLYHLACALLGSSNHISRKRSDHVRKITKHVRGSCVRWNGCEGMRRTLLYIMKKRIFMCTLRLCRSYMEVGFEPSYAEFDEEVVLKTFLYIYVYESEMSRAHTHTHTFLEWDFGIHNREKKTHKNCIINPLTRTHSHLSSLCSSVHQRSFHYKHVCWHRYVFTIYIMLIFPLEMFVVYVHLICALCIPYHHMHSTHTHICR